MPAVASVSEHHITGIATKYQYQYALNDSCVSNYCAESKMIAHDNSVKDKTITHDDVTDLHWVYVFGATTSSITSPDGGVAIHTFQYGKNNPSDWRSGLVYRIDENGSIHQRIWARNIPYGLQSTSAFKTPNNPFIQRDGVTASSRTAVTDYIYDKNGNLRERSEYDWVTYNADLSQVTGLTKLRVESLAYHVDPPNASDTSDDSRAYWRPNPDLSSSLYAGGPRRLNAVETRATSSNGAAANTYASTTYTYDNALTRGNVTQENRWDAQTVPAAPTSTVLTWTKAYDAYGNLTDIYEPSSNGEPVRRTHVEFNIDPDFPSEVFEGYVSSSSWARRWHYEWNTNAGLIINKKDVDNNLTTSYDYDDVGRQDIMDEANFSRRTTTAYDDAARKVTVERDLKVFQDALLWSATYYDQLGRVRLVRKSDGEDLTTDEDDGIKVTTKYGVFNGGSCVITSTPYRSTSDFTLEWERTISDQLNRPSSITMFNTEPTCISSADETGTTSFSYDQCKLSCAHHRSGKQDPR